ncbi:hypothetical protein CALVIDRAFT_466108, partial [Calocera viscosa TUFC12733]
LRRDQRRAYDIISDHLHQTLSGQRPGQLLMMLYGEGGTGKSRVIQSITQRFTQAGKRHLLIKAAYTGIAASLIDGFTLH